MHYDLAVIGAGPGGYVAAIYGGKKKAKVALIEKGELGGTCLNRGCIPTKALIHGADLYNDIKEARHFGITAESIELDWKLLQKRSSRVVKTLTKGVESLLQKNGVTVLKGRAHLSDKNTVIISGQENKVITADKIILATGSTPSTIPVPGKDLKNVIDSEQALFLEKIPESMLIIGAGAVGLELGYVYNTFGTKITIVEALPNILPKMDEEVSKELRKNLERQGIKFYTNAKVKEIKQNAGMLQTIIETTEGIKFVDSEKVLVAAGRKPAVDSFKNTGLKIGKSGVMINDYLQTNIENIYAVGDVTGKSMLAHVASHQGIIAAKNALGGKVKADYKVIPTCIYTNPQIGSVGLSEDQARRMYKNIKIGKFPYAASGKAQTLGKRYGFVKIISESKYDEVLGVHIIGPQATELIAEAALAIKLECTAQELAQTIHAHPTLSETLMEAAFDSLGEPIHKA